MINLCPVCATPQVGPVYPGGVLSVDCKRCGRFRITRLSLSRLEAGVPQPKRANLSGWIREHQDCIIGEANLPDLLQLPTPSVGKKAERLLLSLGQLFPKPGDYFDFGLVVQLDQADFDSDGAGAASPTLGLEILAVTWSQDQEELLYIVDSYLLEELGHLERNKKGCYRITPKGWAEFEAIKTKDAGSNIGFIAMWFDPSMDTARDAIEAGVKSAGYDPLRVDKLEHNNKIDDEILAAIRRSRFVVADFTNHRGGVYFEAGFGLGLGKQVIWLCREDDLAKTHFDNRQYNFIVWKGDNLEGLSSRLQNRIEATLGRGTALE